MEQASTCGLYNFFGLLFWERHYNQTIITEDKIIIRRPYKEDRIITYSEIHEAAKNKKIVMRGRFLYVPTNGKPIKMYVLRFDLRQLAINRIREKANIPYQK